MAFGALFRNPATGSVQIDENHYNFGLVSKSTVTANSAGGLLITVTSSGSPILAFQTPYYVSLSGVEKSGATWTFHYRLFSTTAPYQPAPGATAICYVFDRPLTVAERPLPQYGMIIRNPVTGELVFRSDQPPLVVVDYQSGTAAWESGIGPSPAATAYPAGRTYAVAPTQRCGWRRGVVNPVGWGEWELAVTHVAAGFRINSSQLQCAAVREEYSVSIVQVAPASFNFWLNPWGCLVVDVTALTD